MDLVTVFTLDGTVLGSADYNLGAKSAYLSFFINKVLSEPGHTHLFRYYPRLLLCLMAKFFATGTMSARNPKTFNTGCL